MGQAKHEREKWNMLKMCHLVTLGNLWRM